jgi:hypothetical protein
MSEHESRRRPEIGPAPGTGRTERRNWAAPRPAAVLRSGIYLLLWALWPLVILNPTSSPLVPFGPLIAAMVVSLLAGGPRELLDLLRQLTPSASQSDPEGDRCHVASLEVLRRAH